MQKAQWLETTDEENAFDYLEKAVDYISKVEQNPIDWKWVSISLHGALYGFAIAACQWGNPYCIFEKGDPNKNLIDIRSALQICLNQSETEKDSVKKLCELLRNKFIHFNSNSLSLNLVGLPKTMLSILKQIETVALHSGRPTHLSDSKISQIKILVESGIKELGRIDNIFQEEEKQVIQI